ncbi:MAG: cadherin-like beta sandwich domain-containing protein [Lachnospiraceae bacterium]|nr:cadherin-like beta sandwich domain-containing protein [Lachnospiraceae bacterium]
MKNKIKLIMAAFIGCILILSGTMPASAAGALTMAVSSGSVAAGETVTITAYAKNAAGDDVTSDMTITYDSAKLEYVSATGTNASGGGGTVKATGTEISVKFKAISSGDAYVKVEGAALTAAGAHIMVSGTAAGSTTTETGTTATTSTNLSGDNSLSSLSVSPGTLSPAFKSSTTQYTVSVGSDVNELQVTPVTSNSKAEIVSITGNTGLQTGQNTVTILVKAENGTEASYKITVTKGEGGAAASTDNTTVETSAEAQTTEGTENVIPQDNGMIMIDGVGYTISEDFSEEQIPENFTRTDFEYKGAPYQGVIFDYGHLGMYYLVNSAGEGKFFIYDADRDKFYPYVRLNSGEHFIILMVVPNGAIPPADYEETTLTLADSTVVPAYKFAGEVEQEILNFETTEAGVAGSDFFIFYGMDATGVSGWYQYDTKQGTYQRFNEEYRGETDSGEDYDSLLASYNELSERHKETKVKDRRLIAVLIFVSVVLCIIIINLILKIRDKKDEDDDDYDAYERKTAKNKSVRKEYKKVKAPKKEDYYYDDDEDDDVFDGFEAEPKVMKRTSKPSRPQSAERIQQSVKTQSAERVQQPVKTKNEEELERLLRAQQSVRPQNVERAQQPARSQQLSGVQQPVRPQKPEKVQNRPSVQEEDDFDLEFIDLNDL